MKSRSRDSELILQVVRGERPCSELALVRISVMFQGDSCVIENPRRVQAVAQAADIAKGLVTNRESPEALTLWARVVLAGSSFLDLNLEAHPTGDILLNALWDAAFGRPVGDDALRAAAKLARQQ